MSSDLVVNLRAHASRDNCVSHDWGDEYHDASEDCVQAANEIERLREQNVALKALIRAWCDDSNCMPDRDAELLHDYVQAPQCNCGRPVCVPDSEWKHASDCPASGSTR